MKTLLNLNTKDGRDSLKYVYAFMLCEQLSIKECVFFNPKPFQFDRRHVLPRDLYSVTYNEKNLPNWDTFKTNEANLKSPGFDCTASIDIADTKRVKFVGLGCLIEFNCYGDYEKESKKAIENILSIHKSLI